MRIAAPTVAGILVLSLAACGDDTGGGSGGASSAASTSTGTAASTATGTAVSTATSVGSGGAGGAGGAGGEEVDVGTGGFGGASVDLQCPDTDLEEEDLGEGGPDPEEGDFTMEEALEGLPEGDGVLRAIIDTDFGSITCELFPDIAPVGVANFIGLARGRRAFYDQTGHWIRGRRFYDGLTFHRILDDFVIQGGDQKGNGTGDAGYYFENETDNDESHTPGTLAYANSGNDHSNGSQFYVVAEDGAEFLDGAYTIFGRCEPIGLVDEISEVPIEGDPDEGVPADPVYMHRVHITRCEGAD